MTIKIKDIETKIGWENLENKLAPHTFLQSWEWGESQLALGSKIFRLGIFADNQLTGIAFVFLIKAKRGSFIFCPHGPVIDWTKADKIMPALLNYLIKLGKEESADFIRISSLAPNNQTVKNVFQALNFLPAPVHMMHPELSWILDITPSEDELLKNMEKRTRYSINKATKDGVIVTAGKGDQDIEEFYKIYQATAERQSFVPFSLEYIKKEFAIFSQSNKVLLYFANYNSEKIAAAMIIFNNDSAFYHHGASIRKYKNINAAELIQWQAIREAKNRGLKLYNFWGVVKPEEKNHPWIGLTKFKTGFGGASEEYLHAQDYILTKKYWLNYFVEKLRKIKRGY